MACRRYPLCRRAARRRRRPSPYDAPRRTRFASRSSIDRRPGNGPRRRATPQGFSPRGARDSDGRVPGPAAAGNLGPARPFDGASPAPDGPLVRAALILLAVVALVGIGTAEALISNDQLSQLPGRGRPTLSAGGTALTVIGIVLSAVVYAALGLLLARSRARERSVLPIGIAVGAGAGLLGGAIRASLVRDYLEGVLAAYGLGDLLMVTLAVFVALSVVVSIAAGASLTWLSFRAGRRQLRPRPPSCSARARPLLRGPRIRRRSRGRSAPPPPPRSPAVRPPPTRPLCTAASR